MLEDGDRIIVFPEGGASPEARRPPFKPFCSHEAARQDKLVQACAIDYLPRHSLLRWDVTRFMLPQLVESFGRRRTEVSLELYPAERIADPDEAARRYHDRGGVDARARSRARRAAGAGVP